MSRFILPHKEKEIRQMFDGNFDTKRENHISKIKDILTSFDIGLDNFINDCDKNNAYHFNFELLKNFAATFPNLDYQRFLSKEMVSSISYFYSDSIQFYEESERENVKRIMAHYDRMI